MQDFLDTDGLTDSQRDMLAMLRTFVDRDVLPVVHDLEQADEFPAGIVAAMAEMGLFSLMIPEEYGGLGESLLTYALVVEELARGWMSLSGIINTHFIVAYLILQHGTPEQRSRLLPLMATGEVRGAFSMSEPGCGSDVAAITTKAVRDGDDYVVNGRKMWLTNGARAGIVALLTKTGGDATSVYRTMTTFLLEKPTGFGDVGNGLTIPPPIHKLGYRGVETTELLLDGTRLPTSSVLGGESGVGKGFYQMMDGIEVGRVNVAARGCGVGLRALELAIRYAQQREAFGSRIADHQAIQFSLAEMATKVQAGHQMMVMAARLKDSGQRNDMEAGMAKYLAAEYCKEVVEASLRIHGGYGYASESEIERLYRDAPLLLIGEGTAEMQKMIIGRRLLERYPLRG
jgi:alkylation response protein AidB-like acyl-CoA dehydrogenase